MATSISKRFGPTAPVDEFQNSKKKEITDGYRLQKFIFKSVYQKTLNEKVIILTKKKSKVKYIYEFVIFVQLKSLFGYYIYLTNDPT